MTKPADIDLFTSVREDEIDLANFYDIDKTTNQNVTRLQEVLVKLDYWLTKDGTTSKAKKDGIYGPATSLSVEKFRKYFMTSYSVGEKDVGLLTSQKLTKYRKIVYQHNRRANRRFYSYYNHHLT